MSDTYHHRGAEILALMREIEAMPERRLMIEMQSLGVSLYVYTANYRELRGFLEFVRRDPSMHDLWHMTTLVKSQAVARDIARLVHNHVASVKSLVEHTRRLVRRLYSDGQFPEYQERVDAVFRDDQLVQFVQCLRNILLHATTAPLVFHGTMVDEGVAAANEVGLDVEDLRSHADQLNRKAMRYLDACDDVLDLPTLIDAYHTKVVQFYRWFGERQDEIHAEELSRYHSKERELFILKVEDELDGWFANPDAETNPAPADRGLFMGLFDISEFELLETMPPGSQQRADLAISLLAARFRIPDSLEEKIRAAYADPEFFKWNAFHATSIDDQ